MGAVSQRILGDRFGLVIERLVCIAELVEKLQVDVVVQACDKGAHRDRLCTGARAPQWALIIAPFHSTTTAVTACRCIPTFLSSVLRCPPPLFFLLLFLCYLEEVIPQSILPNLFVTSSKLWSEPTVPDGLLEIATISR